MMIQTPRTLRTAFALLGASLVCLPLAAQSAAGSPPAPTQKAEAQTGSSSSSGQPSHIQESSSRARIARAAEAGGSSITLENSESLFDLAVALNACGYDADLANSSPVRSAIREEVNDELRSSSTAREARDGICTYINDHTLADRGQNVAQYVSLALYTNPPPALTTSVGETELPPDSTQVVNILPLLRTFNEQLHLHAIWVEHLPEYTALNDRIHDPLTKMVLSTNIFLRLPTSSYDGRRFLVLLEPMLAPSTTNARVYANDYIAVASPNGATKTIHMDQVRHIYLQYMVEPLVYARAAAMDRLLPLLKPVREAPIDFIYRSDITAFITENLIRAIEARLLEFDFPRPTKPTSITQRTEMIRYDADNAAYEKKTEALRRDLVERDMRLGWGLTEYFYNQLILTEHDSASLKEDIGQMVYGMDVERERKRETQITFYREDPNGIHRTPLQLNGIRLAEANLMKGDLATAEDIAQKVLDDPNGDHPEAHYLLARVELMQQSPDDAIEHFSEAIKTSKNPRTLAWSHIYLGRLYDTQPDRPKAVEEYKAAMAVRDSAPDTKAAAEKGIKAPFTTPRRAQQPAPADEEPLDPSGKAEKEAYRPEKPN